MEEIIGDKKLIPKSESFEGSKDVQINIKDADETIALEGKKPMFVSINGVDALIQTDDEDFVGKNRTITGNITFNFDTQWGQTMEMYHAGFVSGWFLFNNEESEALGFDAPLASMLKIKEIFTQIE